MQFRASNSDNALMQTQLGISQQFFADSAAHIVDKLNNVINHLQLELARKDLRIMQLEEENKAMAHRLRTESSGGDYGMELQKIQRGRE